MKGGEDINDLSKEDITPSLPERLKGITVAMVTPLEASGRLDVDALERLIEQTIANGACCLFPLGWAGEGPLLTESVRQDVLRETCRIAKGRLPVMAGVSEQSLPRAVATATFAKEVGAESILATPPYSYQLPQKFLLRYFEELMAVTEMPLVVYQSSEIGVRMDIETIEHLSEMPGCIGLKTDMPYAELQQAHKRLDCPGRFAVISGDEHIFGTAMFLGVRHFILGGPGNLCLRHCVSTYRSAVAGDWEVVRQKDALLRAFCDAIYQKIDSPYAGVKYAMHRLGICSARITSPIMQLPPEQQQTVITALEQFKDILDMPLS